MCSLSWLLSGSFCFSLLCAGITDIHHSLSIFLSFLFFLMTSPVIYASFMYCPRTLFGTCLVLISEFKAFETLKTQSCIFFFLFRDRVSLYSFFLIRDWCQKGPAQCQWCHPWTGDPGCCKKAGWASHNQCSFMASASVPVFRFLPPLRFCLVFLQWPVTQNM